MSVKSLAMSVKNSISQKLNEAFAPESLDVADESHIFMRVTPAIGRAARRISVFILCRELSKERARSSVIG